MICYSNSFKKITLIFLLGLINRGILYSSSLDASINMPSQPFLFEENRGQFINVEGDLLPEVLYKASSDEINILLTSKGLSYLFVTIEEIHEDEDEQKGSKEHKSKKDKFIKTWSRFDMNLLGADIRKSNIQEFSPAIIEKNYYLSHCQDGITHIKSYRKLIVKDIYPKIDWVMYMSENGLKYDFVLHPESNIQDIQLLYEGAGTMNIKSDNIHISTPMGSIQDGRLYTYNQSSKEPINCSYNLISQRDNYQTFDIGVPQKNVYHLSFKAEKLPSNQTVVIDPPLTWFTYYTGNGLIGTLAIDGDANGNMFITGYNGSSDIPLVNNETYFDSIQNGNTEVLILKLDNKGVIKWATLYGGSNLDQGEAIATDANGNIFVAGFTNSLNFPVFDAGTYFDNTYGGTSLFGGDAFIAKFDNQGNRLWGTYIAGQGNTDDWIESVATDNQNNVFITGFTASPDFPLKDTGTYFDPINNGLDAFVMKFDNFGDLEWSTFWGGSGTDQGSYITTDGDDNIFLTGWTSSNDFPLEDTGTYFDNTKGMNSSDVFISKFNNNGDLVWSTLYGGDEKDQGFGAATDEEGNLYITGLTESANFPSQDAGTYYDSTLSGSSDAFVLKFDNAGNRLWATLYGGSDKDCYYESRIAIGDCNHVFVLFQTISTDLFTKDPEKGAYYDDTLNGDRDFFITEFYPDGELEWATYFGSSGRDLRNAITINKLDQSIWLTGEVWGADSSLPLKEFGNAYYDATSAASDDSYIARFARDTSYMTITDTSVCYGDSVHLYISGGDHYLWKPSSQLDDDTSNMPLAIIDSSVDYTVYIFKECRVDSQVASITMIDSVEGNAVSDISICVGESIQLLAEGGTTYSWSPPTGLSDVNIPNPIASPDETISYGVVIEGCGYPDSVTVTLHVYQYPIVEIGDDTVACQELPLVLDAGDQPEGTVFNWSNEAITQSIQVEIPGTYWVMLNNNGCVNSSDTLEATFMDCRQDYLFIPNVFTPNDDGENDFFRVKSENLKTFKISLYNNLGKLVFESLDPNFKWLGPKKEASSQVFTYKVEFTSLLNETIAQHGTVLLAR